MTNSPSMFDSETVVVAGAQGFNLQSQWNPDGVRVGGACKLPIAQHGRPEVSEGAAGKVCA